MNVHCPRDQHLRFVDPKTGQLSCHDTTCQCHQCHRSVSPQERRKWLGKK